MFLTSRLAEHGFGILINEVEALCAKASPRHWGAQHSIINLHLRKSWVDGSLPEPYSQNTEHGIGRGA
jgi:hypothetical protein